MNSKPPSPSRRAPRQHAAPEPSLNRKPDTKTLLIETAERLFGRHGLDGISLREITAAAGQANSNVVQYHFKNKEGLISAILEAHVEQFESQRREYLQKLPTDMPARARHLLKILWLPAMAIKGSDGSHSYCRFLLQYLIHPHKVQHPLVRFYDATESSDALKQHVASLIEATRMLRDLYRHLPVSILNLRLSALSMMFLATVVEHDNRQFSESGETSKTFDVEPILDIALAALNAPA